MPIRDWLLDTFFRNAVDERLRLSLPARDAPSAGWRGLNRPALEPPWHTQRELLEDAVRLAATNPLAARIVKLSVDFTVGQGFELVGDPWARAFFYDPSNRLSARVRSRASELAVCGELFVVLSRNVGGPMTYVREVSARLIDRVETSPDDRERELGYHQQTDTPEGRSWPTHTARGVYESRLTLGLR
ncbi:MAG: hypothetical protein GXY52_10925 [Chloroflexi bacterium]|nr:hypothetical protein [Chloroflexota bacterium]